MKQVIPVFKGIKEGEISVILPCSLKLNFGDTLFVFPSDDGTQISFSFKKYSFRCFKNLLKHLNLLEIKFHFPSSNGLSELEKNHFHSLCKEVGME